jgi:hypothetical protein
MLPSVHRLDQDQKPGRASGDEDHGMAKQRHEPGRPMTLGNMRAQGVQHLPPSGADRLPITTAKRNF